MTPEQLAKIPLHFVSHCNMEHELITFYSNAEYGIAKCVHTPYRNGEPSGNSYAHYMVNGTIFKSRDKFLEAIKDIPCDINPKDEWL